MKVKYEKSLKAPSSAGAFLLAFFAARICGTHNDVIAVDAIAVKCLDGLVRLGVAGHLEEAEAFGSAGESVFDQFDVFNFPKFSKQALQSLLRSSEGQVSEIDIHAAYLSPTILYLRICLIANTLAMLTASETGLDRWGE